MFDPKNPNTGDPFKDDFRNFVWLVWKHLNLPDPTPVQYDMAWNLQNSPRRVVIEAFRGVGKSWITSAFVLWLLLNDPDLGILVVSASKERSDAFTTFTLRLINEVEMLQHLIPRGDQRNSKIAFDVAPAKAKHSPSVKSVGITGQLAGSRADFIIADDVEVPNNSLTQTMRDKLSEAVKELDAILKPGDDTRIIYLGTPQTEMSLYNALSERGYTPLIWPARIPLNSKIEQYGSKLAPYILDLIARGAKEMDPVDPLRFDDRDLLEREASYGRSGFALQFMLDTTLSDAERYPLRLRDLVVMQVPAENAPMKVEYGSAPEQMIQSLPVVGFAGDKLYRPMWVSPADEWAPYTGSVMTIDPSGRGADETGYAVTKMLNGRIFVPACGGLIGGYNDDVMKELSRVAQKYNVNYILIESNFGDGMFTQLLKPHLRNVHNVTVEEIRHHGMKEARIIDALEPVMNQHKLVVDPALIESDFKSRDSSNAANAQYQLFHQLTRITRERGALGHDDRLEALAMGVAYWVEAMSADEEANLRQWHDDRLQAELDKFMESATGAKARVENWMYSRGR